MNCYGWADTFIIATSKSRAKELLDKRGLEPQRFPVKLLGGDDYLLSLHDRETLEPIDITVAEYAKRFGEHVMEVE